jgi:multiple antibiotic resistance protein
VREQEEISYEHDVSVFPRPVPLLAGPGAITTVLLYTGERSTIELAAFAAVLLAVLLLTLASLLLAPASCASSGRPARTSSPAS